MKVAVRSETFGAALVDEDIVRSYLMRELGAHFLMGVLERYRYYGFFLRER